MTATCSGESERLGEQLAGTAATAVAWVALEQNGPWGPRAFTQSHLDPELGAQIEARASAANVRPMLIRNPGRHDDDHHGHASHTVLIGYSLPGRSWLAEARVDDPAVVRDLDWAALASGEVPAFAHGTIERTDRPHLLVCTNGTRDVCCAVRGRPIALAAAAARPGQVWEATHTGGHRFAPTAVLLPFGTLHGRLTDSSAVALLAAAEEGQTILEGARGRSTWPPAGQVAELAVRDLIGETSLDALVVAGADDTWLVTHTDGRAWRVNTTVENTGIERAASCGKRPEPLSRFVCDLTLITDGAVADESLRSDRG